MGPGNGFHIPGCDTWQRVNPALPYRCVAADDGAATDSCEHMRDKARRLSPTPRPFSLEREPLGAGWTYGRPSYGNAVPADFVTGSATEGRSALAVPLGYTEVASPVFRTADVAEVGDQLSVDVFIPAAVPNPWWVGSLGLSFVSLATSTYAWLGQIELTTLPRGQWSRVSVPVPAAVQAVFLGDSPGEQLIVTMNTSSPHLLIDGLRFSGALQRRTALHRLGSEGLTVATTPLLSFEHRADWSSTATLSLSQAQVSEGASALAVAASGWTVVSSRWFGTGELPTPTGTMGLDVFVPAPEASPWWTGEVRLHATCPAAGLYGAFLGNRPLTHLFLNEFNHVTFALPPAAQQAFSTAGNCKVDVVLNVMAGSGTFLLDRLGFR